METYSKLFSSIIHSTIWREPHHRRIVWVTMLAMKDRDGQVWSSLPGLADAARVTLEECIDALDSLKSPDQYSRCKEYEGRRIAEIDGGWLVLNHRKYRDMVDREVVREQTRIRVNKLRERRKRESDSVTQNVTDVTHVTGFNAIRSDQIRSDTDHDHETPLSSCNAQLDGGGDKQNLKHDILSVFAHYRMHHPRAHPKPKSTSKEWRAIRARLAEGHTVEQLCRAIDGMHMTPHNLGQNERGQEYLGLELCMRNGDQVDRFARTAEHGPPKPQAPVNSKDAARLSDRAFTEAYNARCREQAIRDSAMVHEPGGCDVSALPSGDTEDRDDRGMVAAPTALEPTDFG